MNELARIKHSTTSRPQVWVAESAHPHWWISAPPPDSNSDSFVQEAAGFFVHLRCGGNPILQDRARRVGRHCLTLSRHLPGRGGLCTGTRVIRSISQQSGRASEEQVAANQSEVKWKSRCVAEWVSSVLFFSNMHRLYVVKRDSQPQIFTHRLADGLQTQCKST